MLITPFWTEGMKVKALCTHVDDRCLLLDVSQGHEAILCGLLYVTARHFSENPCERNRLQGQTDCEQCFSMLGSPSSLRLEKELVLPARSALRWQAKASGLCRKHVHAAGIFFFNKGYSIKSSMPTHLSLRSDLVLVIRPNYSPWIAVIKRKASGTFGAVYIRVLMRIGYNAANVVI